MRSIKIALLVALLALLAGPASAVDPECQGVTQSPTLDYSGGQGRVCLSQKLADGSTIPDTKVVSCSITFYDGNGAELGQENFSGAPGSLHTFPVPRDGIGSSTGVCTVDSLSSDPVAGTVVITYPVAAEPNPPVLLP